MKEHKFEIGDIVWAPYYTKSQYGNNTVMGFERCKIDYITYDEKHSETEYGLRPISIGSRSYLLESNLLLCQDFYRKVYVDGCELDRIHRDSSYDRW